MIIINGKEIHISKNNTFNVPFDVSDWVFKNDDRIVFTVKDLFGHMMLQKEMAGSDVDLELNILMVEIPVENMRNLAIGTYLYDFKQYTEGSEISMCTPQKLKVLAVVNDA